MSPPLGNALGGVPIPETLPVTPTARFTNQATDPAETASNFQSAPGNVAETVTPDLPYTGLAAAIAFLAVVFVLGNLFDVQVG